eukprot:4096319-Pleurochrysis_carterae.AAC.1
MALPVAVARPIGAVDSHIAQPLETVHSHTDAPPPTATDVRAGHSPTTPAPTHFQRSLGSFNLRSSRPTALLVTRRHRKFDAVSDAVRAHGCAFAASSVSTDPRTRKQAMAEDAA